MESAREIRATLEVRIRKLERLAADLSQNQEVSSGPEDDAMDVSVDPLPAASDDKNLRLVSLAKSIAYAAAGNRNLLSDLCDRIKAAESRLRDSGAPVQQTGGVTSDA